MKKISTQVVITAFTILLSILVGYNSSAQNQPTPKADNTIHDRMTALMQKSDKVILPEAVIAKLNTINASHPRKNKAIFLQTAVLKVMYNKALSNTDIHFFGEQILKSTSTTIGAITTDIKQQLTLTK